jgi:uncharacterized protein
MQRNSGAPDALLDVHEIGLPEDRGRFSAAFSQHRRCAMKSLRATNWIALALVSMGGLNWLLVGAFDFDLVAALFGEMSVMSRAVYVLVGVAAIYTLIATPRLVRHDHPPMQTIAH